MKHFVFVIFVLMLPLTLPQTGWNDPGNPPMLEQLKTSVQTYFGTIQTLQAKVEVLVNYRLADGQPEGEPWLLQRISLKMAGPRKIQYQLESFVQRGGLRGRSLCTFNGDLFKSLNYRGSENKPLFAARRPADYSARLQNVHTILSLMGFYVGPHASPAEALSASPESLEVITEILDELELVKFTVNTGQDSQDARQVYYFDPNRGMAVYRSETHGALGVERIQQVATFQEFSEQGVWIPVKGQVTAIVRDWFGNPTGSSYDAWLTCSEVAINQPLDNALFDIEFPPGTKVVDGFEGADGQ